MNLEKRVFETLFKNKIDLSAQKIELSVMDAIDSKTSKANNELLAAARLAQQSIMGYEAAADLFAEAEFLANKAIPQAKELGAKALVKQLQSLLKAVAGRLKRTNSIASKIKSLL